MRPLFHLFHPRLLVVLGAVAAVTSLPAVERISLHVGRIDGGSWSSGDVELELGFPANDRLSVKLSTDGLSLPEPFATLNAISVD